MFSVMRPFPSDHSRETERGGAVNRTVVMAATTMASVNNNNATRTSDLESIKQQVYLVHRIYYDKTDWFE